MSEACGSEFLLSIGTTDLVPVFTQIACIKDTAVNVSRETVDITTKDSNGARDILGSCGVKTCTITGGGVFNSQDAFIEVQQAAITRTQRVFRVTSDLGDTWEGKFLVSAFDRNGSFNSAEEFAMTLENASMIVYTPAALP